MQPTYLQCGDGNRLIYNLSFMYSYLVLLVVVVVVSIFNIVYYVRIIRNVFFFFLAVTGSSYDIDDMLFMSLPKLEKRTSLWPYLVCVLNSTHRSFLLTPITETQII